MNIVVRGRNVSISERVEEYVEKKIGKLERYLPIIDEARMELSQEETRSAQHRMIAQLTVRSRGKILRAEERDQDLFAAIDLVAEKMQRQITRFKDRLYSRGQHGSDTVRVPEEPESVVDVMAEMEPEPVGTIVRTKAFAGHADESRRSDRADGVAGARFLRVLQQRHQRHQCAVSPPHGRLRPAAA